MKLTWYGTASLILEENGKVIAFDPFGGFPIHSLSRRRGSYRNDEYFSPLPVPHEKEFQRASEVFVTHGHFDHIYHIPRVYFRRKVKVYCTETPWKKLRSLGVPEKCLKKIQPGFRGSCGPFQIHAFQGKHCKFDRPLMQKTICSARFFRHPMHLMHLLKIYLSYPEAGEILFYEVRCSGYRIQIMGSMNLDENVKYPVGADVLVLPLQGRSDQDIYALQFVEKLKPKMVLIDHHDDAFPPISGKVDPSGFIKNVEERLGIPCVSMRKGEAITYE